MASFGADRPDMSIWATLLSSNSAPQPTKNGGKKMRALFDGRDGPSALLRLPKRIVLHEGVPEGGLEEAQENL